MKNITNIFLGAIVLIVFLILTIPYCDAGNITVTGIADADGGFSNEKIIEVSDSGSKNLYGIDNIVGAKNKIISYENKDKYIIDGYTDEDGTFYKGIYPNGEQNNMDKKECYINGTLSKQPRFYGKDCPILRINYTQYLHDEITVVFNNTIGNRSNSLTNTLGVGDTWSNNGKIFDNQISSLELINTTEGEYSFLYWIDETGEIANNFSFSWVGNTIIQKIYTAIYDFIPHTVPEPIENETDNNITDNETEEPQNETNNNNKTIIPQSENKENKTSTLFEDTTNTENETITITEKQEQTRTSKLNQHTTGINISNLLAILLMLICFGFLLQKTKRE